MPKSRKEEQYLNHFKMDLDKEMQSRGTYPIVGTYYGYPYSEVERLNPPITPRENLLRYYRGTDYEWVPDVMSDQLDITPHCIPDVDACDFEGGFDAFGVKWIPVPGGDLPSFVEPGFIVLEDIADWKSLSWPDVDSWPWAEYAAKYNDVLKDDDRFRRGVILSGYFERLISLMSFEGAAMALVEDPESVMEFFDKLTELNIAIMRHYIDDFHCDGILIHDDWSAQRSPFFSLQTAQTLLVPYIKRMVDYAHERGVIFTLHSCGNGEDLIPAMLETGADDWQAQANALDLEACYEKLGDAMIFETYPEIPPVSGKELEKALRDIFQKACVRHRGLPVFMEYDPANMPELRRLAYQIGREMVSSGQAK